MSYRIIVLVAFALLTPATASAQFDALIGGMMGQAMREAERHNRAEQTRRADQDWQRRQNQRSEQQRKISAAEKKADEKRRAEEKAELARQAKAEEQKQKRQDALAKVVPAANSLTEEGALFIKENPATPNLIKIADAMAGLRSAIGDEDPDLVVKKSDELAAELNRDPKYASFLSARAERKREENARLLADAIVLGKQQKAFLLAEIARDAAAPEAAAFVTKVKLLDEALSSPELDELQPLTQETDRLVRQNGLRERFILASTSADTPAAADAAAAKISAERPSGKPIDLGAVTTQKNKFLIDGPLGDFVTMYNASKTAPHVVRNLRGEIIFDGATAEVCLLHDDGDAQYAKASRQILKTYKIQSMKLERCDLGRLTAYDVIASNRGLFLRADTDEAMAVVKAIEVGTYEALVVSTEQQQAEAAAAEAVHRADLERDLEVGGRAGFGIVLFPKANSSTLCAVVSEKVDTHRQALVDLGIEFAPELRSETSFVSTSLEAAFVNVKRSQCAAVYASAEGLKDMLPALKRDQIAYELSLIWIAAEQLDQAEKTRAEQMKAADQQAVERKRRVEEEDKLAALREKDDAATRERRQETLRNEYGNVARAAAAAIGAEVKEYVDTSLGSGEAHFGAFAAWYQSRLRDHWELMTFNTELHDYGVSDWKGRSVEAALSKITLRMRNRALGEYRDDCFVFGQLVDTEFSLTRDHFVQTCDNEAEIIGWKSGREFQSRWIVN